MAKNIRGTLSNVVSNSKRMNSPIPVLLVGLALILFWVLASVLQIQTSEAFLLKGPAVTFVPNWGVLKQPLDLVQGRLSTDMAKATMWGWGIELIYLVCIVGYEVAHESVKASNRHLATWFRTGAVALIAFDAYADLQYGQLASGFWEQVAFAGVTAFNVAFFGVIGFGAGTFLTVGAIDLLAHLGPTGLVVGGIIAYAAARHGPELASRVRENLPSPASPQPSRQTRTVSALKPRGSQSKRTLLDRALGRFPAEEETQQDAEPSAPDKATRLLPSDGADNDTRVMDEANLDREIEEDMQAQGGKVAAIIGDNPRRRLDMAPNFQPDANSMVTLRHLAACHPCKLW